MLSERRAESALAAGVEPAGGVDAPIAVGQSSRVSLLTGGADPHYAIPLAEALANRNVVVDLLCSDDFLDAPAVRHPNIRLFPLYGDTSAHKRLSRRVARVASSYSRLVGYAARTDAPVFHILWDNRFALLDRVALIAYYRALGKRLVFTAHNVDTDERDGTPNRLRRQALRFMYRRCDHVFVHTRLMKEQLHEAFQVPAQDITTIPFGLNTVAPRTTLRRCDARERLGISQSARVVLFFGNIAPYKGLEYLIDALSLLRKEMPSLVLLIAGRAKDASAEHYWSDVANRITGLGLEGAVIRHIRYIADAEIETFFTAADVCALPYVSIYQTGVLFLAYRYGVPVVATDVGCVRDDLIAGRTGFICRPRDASSLAAAIRTYFGSALAADLESTRRDIAAFAHETYSWDGIARTVMQAYTPYQAAAKERT